MIHLYTGDGKGKTTAALGLALRAAGGGMPVIFAQFMKGSQDTGELHSLAGLENIRVMRCTHDFGFYACMSEEDKQRITKMHDQILDSILEEIDQGRCFLVVLDEITYPVKWKLLDMDKLQRILSCREIELVCTGRDAADFLWNAADYITKMCCVRHPFEKGIAARKGVEY